MAKKAECETPWDHEEYADEEPLEKTIPQATYKFSKDDLSPGRLPSDLLGELVHSRQVGPGLWNHHWLRGAHTEFGYHTLSRSSDPLKPAVAFLAVARGPKDQHFSVMGSGVRESERGRGLGKTLYNAAIDHHGSLQSDSHTTEGAERLWAALVAEHGGEMGRRGSLERHLVEKKP